MRKLLILAALALAACSHSRSSKGEEAASSGTQPGDKTWVAQPGDLSPEQVRVVQRSLGDRGFAVELTGNYDDQTRVALSDFQRSRGLPATGNLNAETAAALGIDPADVMPVRGRTQTAPAPGAQPQGATPAEPPAAEPPTAEPPPDEPVSPRVEPNY